MVIAEVFAKKTATTPERTKKLCKQRLRSYDDESH